MRSWVTPAALLSVTLPFSVLTLGQPSSRLAYFTPSHRLSAVGLDRGEISDELLTVRADRMIQSQTFAIMRDVQAVSGAERITGPRLQPIFKAAERQSGFPASTLEAISYLESWGLPDAQSPSGPKGIMQISEATARSMGLRIVRSTRYRVSSETRVVKRRKGKPVTRTVKRRTPYSVTVRDERLIPERAIPAAGAYLARLEQRLGGRDWAIFAYHCGEHCVSDILALTREIRGTRDSSPTVPRMFFSASPVHHRDLYQAVLRQMERDFSPTYWFRIMRAEQLLELYRSDPDAFRRLADDYKCQFGMATRAPNRLSVWLKNDDVAFRSGDDLRLDPGKRLVRAFDDPDFFGYRLRSSINQPYYLQASPAAIGTLTYIAYETRRLHDALKLPGEKFQPLEVSSLVQALDDRSQPDNAESIGHSTGQVFDLAYGSLPRGELECLRFVLDDLGWYGYLGFAEEYPGSGSLHIGCSPSAREFFTQVFQEALAERTPPQPAVVAGGAIEQPAPSAR
jgi:hypothetical protein